MGKRSMTKARKTYKKAKKSYKKKKSRFEKSPAFLKNTGKTEFKWVDGFNLSSANGNAIRFTNIGDSMSIFPCNLVSVGSGTYQRVGDHTKGVSLKVEGQIYPNDATNQTQTEFIKVAVVYDRQPTGALPVYSDIYNDINPSGVNSATAFSSPNITSRSRFTILKEVNYSFPFKASGSNDPFYSTIDYNNPNIVLDWYIPLKGCDTNYLASTSPPVIGNVYNGAIYVLAIGTQTTVLGDFNLAFKTRYVYTDE